MKDEELYKKLNAQVTPILADAAMKRFEAANSNAGVIAWVKERRAALEQHEPPPLTCWQILLTVVAICAVAIVVAGLMFQNAVDMGMIQ